MIWDPILRHDGLVFTSKSANSAPRILECNIVLNHESWCRILFCVKFQDAEFYVCRYSTYCPQCELNIMSKRAYLQ